MANCLLNLVDRSMIPSSAEVTMAETSSYIDDDQSMVYHGTLLTFPADALNMIFSFLDVRSSGRCAQVCSRFRNIMMSTLSDVMITRNVSCHRDYPPPQARIHSRDLRVNSRFMFELRLRKGNMLPSCNINLRVHKSLNRFHQLKGGYHLRSNEKAHRIHFAISVLVRGHTFPKEVTLETTETYPIDSYEHQAFEVAKEHVWSLFNHKMVTPDDDDED